MGSCRGGGVIVTSRILISLLLMIGFWAYANDNSDDFVNQQYVEHLNRLYLGELGVKLKPGSRPQEVFFELEQLEEYQANKSTNKALILSPSLTHVTCNGGPCGGCTRGGC